MKYVYFEFSVGKSSKYSRMTLISASKNDAYNISRGVYGTEREVVQNALSAVVQVEEELLSVVGRPSDERDLLGVDQHLRDQALAADHLRARGAVVAEVKPPVMVLVVVDDRVDRPGAEDAVGVAL